MALHDAAAIVVFQYRRYRLHGFKEKIHANGKIRSVEQRAFALAHQLANLFQVLIPACGAYHNGDSAFHTANHVRDHRLRRSEVNDRINSLESGGREGAAVLVLVRAKRTDVMTTLF